MWGLLRLAPMISYPHAVLFDVVVVVVVVTLGVSLPATLLGFLYYIQVGGVSNLATRSLIIMYKWSFRLLHFSLNVYFLCRISI